MESTSWTGSVPAAIRIECPDGEMRETKVTDATTGEQVRNLVRLKLEILPDGDLTADVWFQQQNAESGKLRLVGPRRVRASLGRPAAVVEPPKPKTFVERMFRS